MTPLPTQLREAAAGEHHDLHCWPTYFRAVKKGLKPYEVRKNDRFFQQGDTVTLHCLKKDAPFHHLNNPRSHERLSFTIGPVLQGGQFGIEPGYCVFTLLSAVEGGEADE